MRLPNPKLKSGPYLLRYSALPIPFAAGSVQPRAVLRCPLGSWAAGQVYSGLWSLAVWYFSVSCASQEPTQLFRFTDSVLLSAPNLHPYFQQQTINNQTFGFSILNQLPPLRYESRRKACLRALAVSSLSSESSWLPPDTPIPAGTRPMLFALPTCHERNMDC